jgi:hypothetical protein
VIAFEPAGDSAAKLRAAAVRNRLEGTVVALVVEVKQRVLARAGVDGDEVRGLLDRLGYGSTGQVLPVANEVYRPLATSRPPAASTR